MRIKRAMPIFGMLRLLPRKGQCAFAVSRLP